MADFLQSIKDHADTPDENHKGIGKAKAGDMSQGHTDFARELSALINDGTIDPTNTETFLNADVYASLSDDMKITVDKMLPNMATLITHIAEFYQSTETPDASPELANLIDTLWQMKERVERHADVFVF